MEQDQKVKAPAQEGDLAGVVKKNLKNLHHKWVEVKENAGKQAEVQEKEKGKRVDWFNLNLKLI